MVDGGAAEPDQAAAALARARGTRDILARGSGPAGTVSAGGPTAWVCKLTDVPHIFSFTSSLMRFC